MSTSLHGQSESTAKQSFIPMSGLALQRKCACGGSAGLSGDCEECGNQRLTVQSRAEDHAELTVPRLVHDVLRSPSQTLDAESRASFEPLFGHDFSHVRVHTGARAAESALAVNALAYTVGRDVVFGAGQFAPQTGRGQRLIAHELTHVLQQRGGDQFAAPKGISPPGNGSEREADRAAEEVTAGHSFRPASFTESAVSRQAGGAPPPTFAGLTATRVAFNNSGAPNADNCAVSKPAALGVDGPALGQNGMEMIFRIHGPIPTGTEFEITRTKATRAWQQDAGAWLRMGGWPSGTSDDHYDGDECQTPAAGRIFAVDSPGPDGTLDPTTVAFPNVGPVAATATGFVWKLTFAEWVIARNRPLGIAWTPISTPLFHRWHSIFSVALGGGGWTRVDTPSGQKNEIELGGIATTGATP